MAVPHFIMDETTGFQWPVGSTSTFYNLHKRTLFFIHIQTSVSNSLYGAIFHGTLAGCLASLVEVVQLELRLLSSVYHQGVVKVLNLAHFLTIKYIWLLLSILVRQHGNISFCQSWILADITSCSFLCRVNSPWLEKRLVEKGTMAFWNRSSRSKISSVPSGICRRVHWKEPKIQVIIVREISTCIWTLSRLIMMPCSFIALWRKIIDHLNIQMNGKLPWRDLWLYNLSSNCFRAVIRQFDKLFTV